MDEDFNNRFRQPASQPMGGRPAPAPSHRPGHSPYVTDLRPAAQQPVNHVQHQPPVQHQPLPAHAPQNHTARPSHGRRNLIILIIVVIAIASGVLVARPKAKTGGTRYFPASISASQINLPVYYPLNLPPGFKLSGYKVVKQNVLSYVVSNSNNDTFYVTIQALPSDSGLAAYKQKISHQIEYSAPAGSVLVGTSGDDLTASIQTTQKDWILINTTAVSKVNNIETITRAFKPVSL